MKRKQNRPILRRCLRVASALMLVFCCSCVDIRYPAKGKPVSLKENTSLVFGRLQIIEDNVDVTRDFCDPTSFYSSADRLLTFTILNLESRRVVLNVVVENDGSFYWGLPPGYYRLINMKYRTDIDPYLAFKFESGNRHIYIGNLVLESESKFLPHLSLRKHKVGMRSEYNVKGIHVHDKFEDEASAFQARFPGGAHIPEKRLMFTNYDK